MTTTNIPVFPCGNFTRVQPHEGMTLRDYFAAKAMAAAMARPSTWMDGDGVYRTHNDVPVAIVAYRIADAMLAEREKGARS